MKKIKHTEWFAEDNLIITTLTGEVNTKDIKEWENSLISELSQLSEGSKFKLLANIYGFKATDPEAHKYFRTIIPATLARYGFIVGYTQLFPEEARLLQTENERGIQCVAAAHAHHDESKIGLYESRFSSSRERFFTDPLAAWKWIVSIPL